MTPSRAAPNYYISGLINRARLLLRDQSYKNHQVNGASGATAIIRNEVLLSGWVGKHIIAPKVAVLKPQISAQELPFLEMFWFQTHELGHRPLMCQLAAPHTPQMRSLCGCVNIINGSFFSRNHQSVRAGGDGLARGRPQPRTRKQRLCRRTTAGVAQVSIS